MTKAIFALIIGLIAGGIDILPMVKNEQIPRASIWFVFAQWTLIGFLTPYVEWPMASWLKGILLGILAMIPVAILSSQRNPKAVPRILISAIPLGAAVGFAASFL